MMIMIMMSPECSAPPGPQGSDPGHRWGSHTGQQRGGGLKQRCESFMISIIFWAIVFEQPIKITYSASDQPVIGLSFQFHYFPCSNYKIFGKYFVPFLFVCFLLVRVSFRPIWKNHIDAKFLFWTIHNSLNKCKNYKSRSHDFIFGLFVLWLELEPRIKPMNYS